MCTPTEDQLRSVRAVAPSVSEAELVLPSGQEPELSALLSDHWLRTRVFVLPCIVELVPELEQQVEQLVESGQQVLVLVHAAELVVHLVRLQVVEVVVAKVG